MAFVLHNVEQATRLWYNGLMVTSVGTQQMTYKEKLFSSTLTMESKTLAKKKNQTVASAWSKTKKK
mgnify:CR=1 FL=1